MALENLFMKFQTTSPHSVSKYSLSREPEIVSTYCFSRQVALTFVSHFHNISTSTLTFLELSDVFTVSCTVSCEL
jgi:hypothetical protein